MICSHLAVFRAFVQSSTQTLNDGQCCACIYGEKLHAKTGPDGTVTNETCCGGDEALTGCHCLTIEDSFVHLSCPGAASCHLCLSKQNGRDPDLGMLKGLIGGGSA